MISYLVIRVSIRLSQRWLLRNRCERSQTEMRRRSEKARTLNGCRKYKSYLIAKFIGIRAVPFVLGNLMFCYPSRRFDFNSDHSRRETLVLQLLTHLLLDRARGLRAAAPVETATWRDEGGRRTLCAELHGRISVRVY